MARRKQKKNPTPPENPSVVDHEVVQGQVDSAESFSGENGAVDMQLAGNAEFGCFGDCIIS